MLVWYIDGPVLDPGFWLAIAVLVGFILTLTIVGYAWTRRRDRKHLERELGKGGIDPKKIGIDDSAPPSNDNVNQAPDPSIFYGPGATATNDEGPTEASTSSERE